MDGIQSSLGYLGDLVSQENNFPQANKKLSGPEIYQVQIGYRPRKRRFCVYVCVFFCDVVDGTQR